MKTDPIVLGHFDTTGTLAVSDPCYVTRQAQYDEDLPEEPDEVFQARVDAYRKVFEPYNEGSEELEVAPGRWAALEDHGSDGKGLRLLAFRLGTAFNSYLTNSRLEWEHEFDLSIDSGMVGLYDIEAAPKSWDFNKLLAGFDDPVFPFGVVIDELGTGECSVSVLRDADGIIVGVELAVS